jgi:HAD superfamily hydrolase (TIGR01509 family)
MDNLKFIFDFDGVIVDSETVHAKAKQKVLETYNIKFDPNIFGLFKGIPDLAFFEFVSTLLTANLIPSRELHKAKKEIYAALLPEVNLVPGFLQLIKIVNDKNIPAAIASSTTTEDFLLIDKKFNLKQFFRAAVTGDDTINHKPHPEPYLKAIALLQTDAASCLAIEDSPNGIKSAKASGCKVMGLTTSFSSEELIDAGANEVFKSHYEIIKYFFDADV